MQSALLPDIRPLRQWRFARPNLVSPRTFWTQIGLFTGALALVALLNWIAGSLLAAALVSTNALVVLGIGLLFSVHATDGEYVTLYKDLLLVDVQRGLKCCRYEFDPGLTCVEAGIGQRQGSYILRSGRFELRVGDLLAQTRRTLLFAEITTALLELHSAPQRCAEQPAPRAEDHRLPVAPDSLHL